MTHLTGPLNTCCKYMWCKTNYQKQGHKLMLFQHKVWFKRFLMKYLLESDEVAKYKVPNSEAVAWKQLLLLLLSLYSLKPDLIQARLLVFPAPRWTHDSIDSFAFYMYFSYPFGSSKSDSHAKTTYSKLPLCSPTPCARVNKEYELVA